MRELQFPSTCGGSQGYEEHRLPGFIREEASARAQKGGLTSTPEPCPNPMEANDVMGEELRSQRRAPSP